MVSGPGGISSLAYQPQQQIQFRPDPGEPAVRLSAPPQQTAGLVSSQEQRNETRLLLRALTNGDDVIYSKRTFTLGLGGSSPVFNAGLTTLVSRDDPNGIAPDQTIGPVTSAEDLRASQEAEAEKSDEEEDDTRSLSTSEEDSSPLGVTKEDEDDLESEETEIENDDQRVERNLSIAQLEQQQALRNGDPVQVEQTDRELKQLEREAEEVDKKKKENKQKQLEIRLKDLQGTTNDAIEETLNAALGVVGVLFGLGEDSNPKDNTTANALG
jgi:hypothetical protein